MEDLRHPDNTPAVLLEKPDFRKCRLRVSTREGSACGRLGGRSYSAAAEADCPTKGGQEVVGSAAEEGLQTTPSLARGVRPVIARRDNSRTRATTRLTRGKGGNEYTSRSTQG